ncbi:hypothetical protein [Legionella cherrii]|uniref:Uncharacterized protein n=1 Tax=Legionella cherrii TaxID=28084 RepID=A0A0W0SGU6_9GAMM|nr:hypothetical protein [Legionella cherrii]KTC82598.1 hypothetical protein Lche_0278 [Legionella cherrii]VEB35299.1 Uncharacterised protein [Legionella cherrii]
MGKSKWVKFHSAHSPLQIEKVNSGEGIRLGEDWNRAMKYTGDPEQRRQILIDGKPITTFADDYGLLSDVDDVEKFFKEVILGKMDPKLKEKDMKEAIDFLKKTFHQGGLMHPVSGALATSMERDALPGEPDARDGKIAYGTITNMQIVVNIIPTKEGFKVKENVGVQNIIVSENGFEKYGIKYNTQRTKDGKVYKLADDPTISREDKGNIIEAQGEIAVDLSHAEKPKISIESNAINYGDHRVEAALHNHSLMQWIIDFVKNAFGYNKIEVLEPVKAEPFDIDAEEMQSIGPNTF